MSTATSRDRARDTILRDGSAIRIRPARPEDEPALVAFLTGLAPESRRMRFAGLVSDLEAQALRWAAPADPAGCSLVAETGIADRIIAHASYDRIGPDSAEVAFIVADELQGRGIATLLLEELAERAQEAGISTFSADVLAENGRMLRVFHESGFPTRLRAEPGAVLVEFPTALTGPARERFERREQIAAAAAVHGLLYPASVAVVGASRRRGTIGGELFHNLLSGGFTGPVYPVNPNADVVQSVAAYRAIGDIPGPVDLAVLVVPATSAVDVARGCAGKGVKTIVVVSPGFAEIGGEGIARQRELLAVCRQAGMRLVGPNCMGVINLAPSVSMNATFSPTAPIGGRVGFLSQSGALGLAIIEHANRLGLGLSSFISIGNKADLSGNDFLQYWEDDPASAVLALYLESVGNPRKFARIARRVGRSKPIIAVKSGRSAAGARATSSHTGALIGASDVTVEALFHQAGVVRTDTLGEFFDVASLLANQPLPAGRRVAILTNGGGPGILAADACDADGLVVPALPAEVRAALAEFLPAEAALGNPVDTIEGTPDAFRRAIEVLAAWEGIDAIIVLFVPPLVTKTEDVAAAIRDAVLELPRPVPCSPCSCRPKGGRAPFAMAPSRCPRTATRRRPPGRSPTPCATPNGGRRRSAASLTSPTSARTRQQRRWPQPWRRSTRASPAREGRWPARPSQAPRERPFAMAATGRGRPPVECYGIPTASWRLVDTAEDAGRAAAEIGGPVALKAVAAGIVHKAEARAVMLSLEGAAAVEEAARGMAGTLAAAGHPVERFFVQQMVAGGVEMLVGVVHDRLFGPGHRVRRRRCRGRAAAGRRRAHHPADRPPTVCWRSSKPARARSATSWQGSLASARPRSFWPISSPRSSSACSKTAWPGWRPPAEP